MKVTVSSYPKVEKGLIGEVSKSHSREYLKGLTIYSVSITIDGIDDSQISRFKVRA